MSRYALWLCALVLAAVAAFPAVCAAVVVEGDEGDDVSEATAYVVDLHGERNRLSVHLVRNGLTVRDAGSAPLKATGTCRRRSSHLVECRGIYEVYIDSGAGADTVFWDGGTGQIYAGRGDDLVRVTGRADQVFGGSGRDRLYGGDRDDELSGGRGADVLHGGPGDDVLWGEGSTRPYASPKFDGPGEDDVLDGGPGRDIASYDERRRGVSADLRSGRGGGPGEADVLRSIEDMSGGDGDDRLAGDDRSNLILGSRGHDVLSGRGGDDTLGAGAESTGFVDTIDAARDRLSCGAGSDRVNVPGFDPLPVDCELLNSEYRGDFDGLYLEAHPVEKPDGVLLFNAICSGGVDGCSRRIVLRHGGVEFARSDTVELHAERTYIPVQVPGGLPSGVIEVRHEGEQHAGAQTYPYLFRYRIRR